MALDANFSKFGYSAHLRTKEGSDSPNSSRTSLSEHDWQAERKKGKALALWRRPVVRQYFHKGLLWRASEVEEVLPFELFVDLLYVGIIGIVGDAAAHEATGYSLLRFSVTFIIGWKMWTDLTLIISWFETDDILQRFAASSPFPQRPIANHFSPSRISVLFVLICLFGYTLNLSSAFDHTWTMLVAFYLTQRLFAATYFVFISYLIPMIRGTMLAHTFLALISAALWIASCHVDYPNRLGLIWIAIAFDLFYAIIIILLMRHAQRGKSPLAKKLGKYFDFWPALNIEHKTERTNAFVTLVFGYSVLVLLFQNRAEYGINAFFGKAVLGLIQAFAFNWLYFEIDAYNLHTHAIRRHIASSFVWATAHLPFIMAYVLAAASLAKIVLAHDCHDTELASLTETYVARSEDHLTQGLRWFYCCGLGIALLGMSTISMSHVHKEIQNQRIAKYPRLALRVVAALILICLPLAEDRLNSLQLVSTTTGIVVFVLMVDVYGSTSKNDSFVRDRGTGGKYSTRCNLKKKDIHDAIKRGETIEVAELADGGGGEKPAFHVQ